MNEKIKIEKLWMKKSGKYNYLFLKNKHATKLRGESFEDWTEKPKSRARQSLGD